MDIKITKENLSQALSKANQLRGYIDFELTIVEQAISNANLANVLTSTYASHAANVIVSDIINCVILNIRKLVEFFRSMQEYVKKTDTIAELAKIHEQPFHIDKVACEINGRFIEKTLDECPDIIKKHISLIQSKETENNKQKFDNMCCDIKRKWGELDTDKEKLSDDFSENHKICIKLWKLRNQRAHFDIEKEERLHIKELRDYFNELTNCMELINLIVDRTSYDYEGEYKQNKRSADEFWNLLKK